MTCPTERKKTKSGLMVEFVGAGGVGKSHLLASLTEALLCRGEVVKNYDSIVIQRLNLANLRALAKAGFYLAQIKPKLPFTSPSFIRRLADYDLKRRMMANCEGIHVCSEGLFQRMRGLYKKSGGIRMERLADVLFRYGKPPDVVVVVEADANTVYERKIARDRPGESFTRESVSIDVQLVEENIRNIDYVGQSIAPGLKMIRVNVESADLSFVTHRLADELQAMLRKTSV